MQAMERNKSLSKGLKEERVLRTYKLLICNCNDVKMNIFNVKCTVKHVPDIARKVHTYEE